MRFQGEIKIQLKDQASKSNMCSEIEIQEKKENSLTAKESLKHFHVSNEKSFQGYL